MLELLNTPAARAALRRWPWVVAGAIVIGAALALVAAMRPMAYVAAVDVVPVRGEAVAGPVTAGVPSFIVGATPERRQALAQLVRSPDVERAVQRELGARLSD